ncbi:MAG: prenyltransferase [Methylotenera sp.]|nr:prenyltransferase [Methylotenera sp.]
MRNSTSEPSPTSFPNSLFCYFFATRPMFLVATLMACLIGVAAAINSGVVFQPVLAIATLVLALMMHAAVNVINDYFDALNGTDAINHNRLYPFTGGSRFIQNGVITHKKTAYLACALLFISVLGGLALTFFVNLGLLALGLMGVLIGWVYSATPFRLNSRGLGEFCVFLGFLGLVVGADYVQRHTFSLVPISAGVPYALLVTSLLYINQFPDRHADMVSGKRTLVVRLKPEHAVWIYLVLVLMALLWLFGSVCMGMLPISVMLSAMPLLFSLYAFYVLYQFSQKPAQLLPAIKSTLASMLSHALLLTIILLWNAL